MAFRVRFTPDAQVDLQQLYDFLLQRDDGDWSMAEAALAAIAHGVSLLENSPFSCRKVTSENSFLRELVIAFGASGYVAMFEIEDAKTVTIMAVRHQREDDYH